MADEKERQRKEMEESKDSYEKENKRLLLLQELTQKELQAEKHSMQVSLEV